MKITKREIIVSIAIISAMLIIGFVISGKITDYQNDKNAEYQKAVHITDTELFQYGMETNVGNAFVYGDLKAVDTVTFDEIGDEYLYVEKVEKWREKHEKWEEDEDGNREKKVWYEWETKHRESKHVDKIEFCGIVFPYNKIDLPGKQYIDTIAGDRKWSWESSEYVKTRFVYYGISTEHTGTIYTRLADNMISDNSPFYKNRTIDEALKSSTSGIGNIAFWVFWILLTCGCVYGFCYLDNRWLED